MTLAFISHWYDKNTWGWASVGAVESDGPPDSDGPEETDGSDKIAPASS